MNRKIILFLSLLFVLVILFFLDIIIGSVDIPLNKVVDILIGNNVNSSWDIIITELRLPKAFTAIFAGAGLTVAGLQMQTLFRNPLAGPYVLGVSSAASLGVALVILGYSFFIPFNTFSMPGNWGIVLAASLGAGLVLFLIMLISIRIRDIMTILILGIMFGFVSSAFVNLLQYFSSPALLKIFVVWSMGSLTAVTKSQVLILGICVLLGILIAFFSSKNLNLLLLGDNYAITMGVKIRLIRIIVFISTSILAGTITGFCGPIGFVGIAVPHLTKILFKTDDHRILIPSSAILGAILMLASDLIAQLPESGGVLPINTVTALIGIPVIVWIIIRNYKFSSAN